MTTMTSTDTIIDPKDITNYSNGNSITKINLNSKNKEHYTFLTEKKLEWLQFTLIFVKENLLWK